MSQVFLGSLLTLIVGGVAAVLAARIEHRRWLRAQRLQAWADLMEAAIDINDRAARLARESRRHEAAVASNQVDEAERRRESLEVRGEALQDAYIRASQISYRVEMLGPDKASTAANAIIRASEKDAFADPETPSDWSEHVDELIAVARRVLRSQ